ncbi:MAG: hypothetical protein F6K17_10090 [Okeania sp. SIO3C4]|nr:hypothetical protein [Okeania sp. SIO3B3]NER02948.1 hypothetical protein [Okeania sp. SIO3C4]
MTCENSYILRGEIPPPCCWVESIGHTGETEYQTGEAGLKAGKYQLSRNDTASKG